MKIHIDTDLGGDIDDLCALAMVLKWPNAEILGITTVAEENGKRAGYTKYALQLVGREDIPIASGADVSGNYYRFKPGYPKEEEYWPEKISPYPNPVDDALELLKKSIEQDAVIVGIGPYTNFCLLDKKYPGILQKAKIFLMGGSVFPIREGYPQWGNDMDYNIQLDIISAKYVFEHANPTLVTMSVSLETFLRKVYLEKLKKSDALGQLIARQAEVFARDWRNDEKLGKPSKNLPDDLINFQYDPLTCAIALGWSEGVEIQEVPLMTEVKEGFLYEKVDTSGKLTKVLTAIDGEKFSQQWLDIVSS